LDGGITQSLINSYLDCPFRFYLYTVLGLVDPENINPNLIYGSIAHRGLEHLVGHPTPVAEFSPPEKDELLEVIQNYTAKHYPSSPSTFPYSAYEMCLLYDDTFKLEDTFKAEQKFQIPYITPKGNKVTLRGKVDGQGTTKIVEHKFVGYNDPMTARLETPLDLQVNLYMYVTGTTECIYDKIQIPDTNKWAPQQRQSERAKAYAKRIFHDHYAKEYPISRNKHLWLDQFKFYRTEEQLQEYVDYVIDPHIDNICAYWEKVTDPNFDPNNPAHYDSLFWIKPIRTFDASRTEKYKCNYYNFIAGDYTLSNLVPAHFYKELLDE
jgi:hypothetical protein